MNCFYLTDSLIFNYEDKTIYKLVSESDESASTESVPASDEKIKITSKNWKELVCDYGWEDLDWEIEHLLDDTKYCMLECGAGGDCFFHSLAEAINIDNIYQNKLDDLLDIQTIRDCAAKMITGENFEFILNTYLMEEQNGEFQGDWDPASITTCTDLQKEIQTPGDNFWADNIIISLLSRYFKTNFIIINSPSLTINYLLQLSSNYKKTIILYYEMGVHYKLVGRYDNKKIQTVFRTLPKKIRELL